MYIKPMDFCACQIYSFKGWLNEACIHNWRTYLMALLFVKLLSSLTFYKTFDSDPREHKKVNVHSSSDRSYTSPCTETTKLTQKGILQEIVVY